MSLVFYGNPRIGLFCAPILIIYASSWKWFTIKQIASLFGGKYIDQAETTPY
jgi:hypothetical protein